jgi:hypothetical protein
MKGSEYFQAIVGKDVAAREQAIWQAVLNLQIVLDWQPLEFDTPAGARVTLLVSRDTLRVGDDQDSVRVCASHRLAQQIADQLDAVLPSARLSDVIWAAADLKVEPATQSWYGGKGGDGTMATTRRMLDYHQIVERQVAARPYRLLAGHHKDWINSPKLGSPGAVTMSKEVATVPAGCNYGWHSVKAGNEPSQTIPTVNVWQMPAVKHVWTHSDYSQQVRLVHRAAFVCRSTGIAGLGAQAGSGDGWPEDESPCELPGGGAGTIKVMDVLDLAYDPDLKQVVEHEPSPYELRHPALPWPTSDAQRPQFEPPITYTGGTGGGGVNVNGTGVGGEPLIVRLSALGLGALLAHAGIKLLRSQVWRLA